MAGNIIPAIATTNAITAGLVVMRAFNVLLEQWEQCQSVYVRLRLNPRNQIFVPDRGKWLINVYKCTITDCSKSISLNLNCRAYGTKSKVHRLFRKTASDCQD